MRNLRKLVYVCCSITLGLMALSNYEGGGLYDVNALTGSPKVDSIAEFKERPEEEVLEGMQEDVYPSVTQTTPPVSGQLSPSITSCPTGRNGMGCSISTSIPPTIPIIKLRPRHYQRRRPWR